MKMPQNETIVLDVAGNTCAVWTDIPDHFEVLQSLGFVRSDDRWMRQIADATDRLRLIQVLIEMKALFSAGRDWSPQELVNHFRETGAISGAYRSISWQASDHYLIEENQ
ncbi:hypothetical protein BWP39_16320 [Paraburkholderia acidicola]|uniref:Uncharacterized protein n=2 Tax=Paraburkholderia acidicola TaxID=1912599 RepID=A0A2A4F167_9BURK|nr:hypothetical protein BWP39_16320 [Paraburkholderia acidicola]